MDLDNVFDDQINIFEKLIAKLIEIGTSIDSITLVKMIKGKIEIEGKYCTTPTFSQFFRMVKNCNLIYHESKLTNM